MRTILVWILILHTVHLPVPFPDLDGECRGTPICSLFELDAWHVLMLGVRPNDDIDRGPIRTTEDSQDEAPADCPFGEPAIVAMAHVTPTYEMAGLTDDSLFVVSATKGESGDFVRLSRLKRVRPTAVPIARTACICFCSWLV